MRLTSNALVLAISFLAGTVSAQEGFAEGGQVIPEVRPVTINEFVFASPEVRSVVADRELDLNHDQILSADEIEPLLIKAARSAQAKSRAAKLNNHREGSWIYNSSPLVISGNVDLSLYWSRDAYLSNVYAAASVGGGDPVVVVPTASSGPSSGPRYGHGPSRRFAKLNLALWELNATGSDELSLVDEEFHRLFASLPGEQRSALLAADAAGDNDGMVTVQEFVAYNTRRLSRMARFEADFGEEAYLEVLGLLGAVR